MFFGAMDRKISKNQMKLGSNVVMTYTVPLKGILTNINMGYYVSILLVIEELKVKQMSNIIVTLIEMFQCGLLDKEPQDKVVRILTWDYFVPSLLANPYYKDLIKRAFGDDIFKPLSRFLFRPIPKIQAIIDNFKRDNFGKYTLGLQIRKIGINKLNDTQEDLFWECAINTTLDNADHYNIKWFLATDNPQTRDRAVREFGDKVVFYDVPIQRNTTDGVIGK